MKKLLLAFFIFSMFIMCQPQKTRFELIQERQNLEIAKGIKKDTIILDFIFGMTSAEVQSHFKYLLNSNRIKLNDRNEYAYEIPIEIPKNLMATFSPEYLNDSLYSMDLLIDTETFSDAVLAQLQLDILYMNKYSNLLEVPALFNKKESDYLFINGNRQIEIDYPVISRVLIEYTDIRREARKNKLDNDEKVRKKKDLINDL